MFFVLKCTTSLTDINKSKERKLRVLHLTITIIKGWATRAPVAQTLQSVRQTCPRTTPVCARLYGFHLVEFFQTNPPLPVKQQS